MPTSIPVPGTGSYIATSDDLGTPSDPVSLQLDGSGDPPAASFPAFGTGVYLGVASGNGTPSNPYVPSVSVSGVGISLPISLPAVDPVFQVDTGGDLTLGAGGDAVLTAGSIAIGTSPPNPSTLDNGSISTSGTGTLTTVALITTAANSFDSGAITTDGSGHLQATTVSGTTVSGTTLAIAGGGGTCDLTGGPDLDVSGGVHAAGSGSSLDTAAITTNGSGLMTMTANPPLALTGVSAITTSTITTVAQCKTALQALCTALGIAQA